MIGVILSRVVGIGIGWIGNEWFSKWERDHLKKETEFRVLNRIRR